jgi:hypothetical protein
MEMIPTPGDGTSSKDWTNLSIGVEACPLASSGRNHSSTPPSRRYVGGEDVTLILIDETEESFTL